MQDWNQLLKDQSSVYATSPLTKYKIPSPKAFNLLGQDKVGSYQFRSLIYLLARLKKSTYFRKILFAIRKDRKWSKYNEAKEIP